MTVPNRYGRKLMHMSTTDVKLIRYWTTLRETETTDGVFRIRGDVARWSTARGVGPRRQR